MPFCKSKILFYAKTGEQSLLLVLVLLVNQNQNQKIIQKLIKTVHESFSSTKLEISKIQLDC